MKAEHEIYTKVKLLGEGSYGKAFLVKSKKEKKFCVIKQLDLNSLSPEERKEALKESKILEILSHPNIIKFHEVYKTKKGKLCIVMDYANGGDLAKRIKLANNNHFSENLILDWFTQICLALKHVHDRKIIHRDLKAQNIFLTKDNIVKLGDFGIARVLSCTVENAKTMVGTPYYLSPEIIENQPYNFKSDIWSLGILLYEMCALKPPFNAESLQFLALKIVRGFYNDIPTHYSTEIKHLIKSMLSVNPRERPSVHQILQSPIITKRIKNYLTESEHRHEFSHTIIHNKNFVQQKCLLSDIPSVDDKINGHPPRKAQPIPDAVKPNKVVQDNYHYQKPEANYKSNQPNVKVDLSGGQGKNNQPEIRKNPSVNEIYAQREQGSRGSSRGSKLSVPSNPANKNLPPRSPVRDNLSQVKENHSHVQGNEAHKKGKNNLPMGKPVPKSQKGQSDNPSKPVLKRERSVPVSIGSRNGNERLDENKDVKKKVPVQGNRIQSARADKFSAQNASNIVVVETENRSKVEPFPPKGKAGPVNTEHKIISEKYHGAYGAEKGLELNKYGPGPKKEPSGKIRVVEDQRKGWEGHARARSANNRPDSKLESNKLASKNKPLKEKGGPNQWAVPVKYISIEEHKNEAPINQKEIYIDSPEVLETEGDHKETNNEYCSVDLEDVSREQMLRELREIVADVNEAVGNLPVKIDAHKQKIANQIKEFNSLSTQEYGNSGSEATENESALFDQNNVAHNNFYYMTHSDKISGLRITLEDCLGTSDFERALRILDEEFKKTDLEGFELKYARDGLKVLFPFLSQEKQDKFLPLLLTYFIIKENVKQPVAGRK